MLHSFNGLAFVCVHGLSVGMTAGPMSINIPLDGFKQPQFWDRP